MSKLTALVVATLVLSLGVDAAAAKSQARVKSKECPSVTILADATRVTQLQNGNIDLKAEIRSPSLTCAIAGDKAKSRLSFSVKSAISPNAAVSARSVPYFVAIISNGEVIGKEVFHLTLPFAGAKRMLTVTEYVDRIDIPVAADKSPDDYAVTIGFQLTQEQVEYNRTASVSRP